MNNKKILIERLEVCLEHTKAALKTLNANTDDTNWNVVGYYADTLFPEIILKNIAMGLENKCSRCKREDYLNILETGYISDVSHELICCDCFDDELGEKD